MFVFPFFLSNCLLNFRSRRLWFFPESLFFVLRWWWCFLCPAKLPPAAGRGLRRVLLAWLSVLQPTSVVQLDHPCRSHKEGPPGPRRPDPCWRLPCQTGPASCGRPRWGPQASAEMLERDKVHILHQHAGGGSPDWGLAQRPLQGILWPLSGLWTTCCLWPRGDADWWSIWFRTGGVWLACRLRSPFWSDGGGARGRWEGESVMQLLPVISSFKQFFFNQKNTLRSISDAQFDC